MARYKNHDWLLPEGTPTASGPRTVSWEAAHAALLMDIRDELQRLNQLLHCRNFTDIPGVLRKIQRNTAKPKRTKKVRR